MTDKDRASTAGYAEEADKLAETYESLTFEQAHRRWLHLVPSVPSEVLDIGAGTGRDAAGLARLGHRVTAAEPVAQMRAHGLRLHADVAIEWIDDILPHLRGVLALRRRFDLVLMTAVWMHLDAGERQIAMGTIAGLMAPGSALLMSLRHGPVPQGRRMFDVSAEETRDLARRHGLDCIHEGTADDMLRRGGVHWTYLAFRGTAHLASR